MLKYNYHKLLRPFGAESKLKIYISVSAKTKSAAQIVDSMKGYFK